MFGLGRRHREEEARRVQALAEELEQVQHSLLEATQRAEKAESEATFLASQNRALAAKIHRLALQRIELLEDKDRVERENKELQIANLQLGNEARVAKAAKADAWQVSNLKAALRQQAAQHEKKLVSIKRRTKALLTAILPGGHNKAGGSSLLAAPSSPSPDGREMAVEDLWDVPLVLTGPSAPDMNLRILGIIGCLYDDAITEDDALAQMTELTNSLAARPEVAVATSRGCSPLPVPKLGSDAVASASEKVDAATDPQTVRERLVADAATETPEISYLGTPCDVSTAPSQGPASPRRLATAAVPVLDLAALVAQAMEEAPLSGRSVASTSVSTAGGPSFTSISQFVLAQPEKLQRLILRHAAATGAKAGQSGFGQPQSPYGTGLPPSAAAANVPGTNDYAGHGSVSLMDPPTQLSSGGALPMRPSLASRLLGLGSSNVANRTPATAAILQVPTGIGNSSTVATVSTSGVVSPSKPVKRSGASAAPKFAKLDGSEKTAKSSQPTGPVMSLPGVKLLSDNDDNISNNFSFSGLSAQVPGDLDVDLKELSLGSTALSLFHSGGRR